MQQEPQTVSNEFITHERPGKGIRGTDSGAATNDWLCSVLCPLQHSIGYMGNGFYRSKDPTNSIKVLKEDLQKTNQTMETTQNTHA